MSVPRAQTAPVHDPAPTAVIPWIKATGIPDVGSGTVTLRDEGGWEESATPASDTWYPRAWLCPHSQDQCPCKPQLPEPRDHTGLSLTLFKHI